MAGEVLPIDERIALALERIADVLERSEELEHHQEEQLQRFCACGARLIDNRCTEPQNHSQDVPRVR